VRISEILHRNNETTRKTRLNTVNEFEAGRRTPTPNNIAALRRAIENGGIRFLFDETGAAAGIARLDARIDLSGEALD
jgi:hypothetical protein